MGLQQLLVRQHDELIERQRQIADSHASFLRMLAGTGARSSRGGGIERLEGMDAVQRRLQELARDAVREVLTFMPGGPQSAAALRAARRNDGHVLGRGVRIRTIGLDGVREDAATLDYARWLTEQRGEFRTAASLPPRMILVDGASALLPIDPDDTRRGALCLSEPALLAPCWRSSSRPGSGLLRSAAPAPPCRATKAPCSPASPKGTRTNPPPNNSTSHRAPRAA
ncbi:hypothetical protein ACFQ2B_02375 [Streptomyces stramineus]